MSDGRRPTLAANRRVLVVDDEQAIREEFSEVLGRHGRSPSSSRIASLERELFDTATQQPDGYEVTVASQGGQAVELVRHSIDQRLPFAAAFVDLRMPPGLDGEYAGIGGSLADARTKSGMDGASLHMSTSRGSWLPWKALSSKMWPSGLLTTPPGSASSSRVRRISSPTWRASSKKSWHSWPTVAPARRRPPVNPLPRGWVFIGASSRG